LRCSPESTDKVRTVFITETQTITYTDLTTLVDRETTISATTIEVFLNIISVPPATPVIRQSEPPKLKARVTAGSLAETLLDEDDEASLVSACNCLNVPMCIKRRRKTASAPISILVGSTATMDATST